jgi:light-regulated signal transduction histidine kinase (bacteriophytochrome)
LKKEEYMRNLILLLIVALPITQRILHQHSGVIDVESNVGKGTTFYIKLPVPKNM